MSNSLKLKRRKLFWLFVVLMSLLTAGSWLRIRDATRNARAFSTAINAGTFERITTLVGPQASFPDRWANPANWGDDGVLFADAYVTPLALSEVLWSQRHVQATVKLDAEPRNGIRRNYYHHTFLVTGNSILRVPRKPDNVIYPVTIRPFNEEPSWNTPKDVADVPAAVFRVGGDEKKLYCLIGEIRDSSSPKKLLVVMPGGDGSSEFSPFVRRLYKHALDDSWLVAQIVAPKWSRTQKIVWPMQSDDHRESRFGSDELFDAVVDDVFRRASVAESSSYLLAWSSSGPAAYRIALRKDSKLSGAIIAMSVFRGNELPSTSQENPPAFYLLQSPDDRVTPYSHAEAARQYMTSIGSRVKLTEYAGGHGWHGDPYQMLSQGIGWLMNGRKAEQSDAPESPSRAF